MIDRETEWREMERRANARIVRLALRLFRKKDKFVGVQFKDRAAAADAWCAFVNQMHVPVQDLNDVQRWRLKLKTKV